VAKRILDAIIKPQSTDDTDEIDEVFNKQRLFKSMLDSQLSIMANSNDVKILCIRRENLNLLSDNIRREIESLIIRGEFRDLDRPFDTHRELEQFVGAHRKWSEFKTNKLKEV